MIPEGDGKAERGMEVECIRIDIPKGESSFVREFDLSEERRIVEGKTIRMRLFTDEFQLDTDAIKNETGTDNPFFRINQV